MFKKNDRVVYVPSHAKENLQHSDVEWGTVTDPEPRTSSELIFVLYDGDKHAKATPQRKLYKPADLQ